MHKRITRRYRYNPKKMIFSFYLIIAICSIGIGYAALTTTLNVDGVANVKDAKWDVHFEDIHLTDGSITATTAATITDATTITFAAKLDKPGDFYGFDVDIVNAGTMVAMIDSISLSPELTDEQKEYFSYTVTYADGIDLASFHKIDAGDRENIVLKFSYLDIENTSLYPKEDETLEFSFTVHYVQNDGRGIERPRLTFEDADWEKISDFIEPENVCSVFDVGDEKIIDMGSFGTHTIRIANCSMPSECSNSDFSETACGLVFEFADIITTRGMNSSKSNVGGWPESQMRTYLNTDIFNALPTDLKSRIIDTKVVTGYGKKESSNFVTTDKLYLLSPMEVWGAGGASDRDTAENLTKQFDYYKSLGITGTSNNGAIKLNGTKSDNWWLRTSDNADNDDFLRVNDSGHWGDSTATVLNGVSPAFRIE